MTLLCPEKMLAGYHAQPCKLCSDRPAPAYRHLAMLHNLEASNILNVHSPPDMKEKEKSISIRATRLI